MFLNNYTEWVLNMVKTFCKGCDFKEERFPPCATYKIATMIPLDNFAAGNYQREKIYPLCHKNAQKINNNQLIISDECDCCNMCKVACPELNIDNTLILEYDDHIILKDLNLTNIALTLLLGIPVASEVKTAGNCRQKRVYIAIKNENNLYLIKVLHSVAKIDFYNRSYKEIVSQYNKQYTGMNIYVAFLLSEKIYSDVKDKTNFNFFTLKSIYDHFKGE